VVHLASESRRKELALLEERIGKQSLRIQAMRDRLCKDASAVDTLVDFIQEEETLFRQLDGLAAQAEFKLSSSLLSINHDPKP
jgi:hypothetical protein